ncbi:condensation domain-containing protein [Paraburkholderia sp. BL6669N2]|nr:condensation domain-containing protein [Paraburkholderia sp. BL6669N2]
MQNSDVTREGPLSFCQELLLFNEIFTGYPPAVSRVAHIDGPLDIDAFRRAADSTIAGHEPLRTTWTWRQGEPVAQVKSADSLPPSTTVTELAADSRGILEGLVAAVPTLLAAGRPPHMRHWLFRRSENDHIWMFATHHMAADAISLKLYAETFCSSYVRPLSDSPKPTTSIEYAQALRTWLDSSDAQAELNWWLCKLEAVPRVAIPVRPPVEQSNVSLERQELRLPTVLRNAVVQTARSNRAPLAAVFLATYAQVASNRGAFPCVITNVPGRSLPGAASTSGACYNSVPLVLSSNVSDSTAISAAANTLFDALDHQNVPAPLISLGAVRRGGLALPDLIPVTFNVIDHPLKDFRLSRCRLWDFDLTTHGSTTLGYSGPTVLRFGKAPSKPTMDWTMCMLPESVVVTLEYSPCYADRKDVALLLASYEAALRSICRVPDGATDDRGAPILIADWSVSRE